MNQKLEVQSQAKWYDFGQETLLKGAPRYPALKIHCSLYLPEKLWQHLGP